MTADNIPLIINGCKFFSKLQKGI